MYCILTKYTVVDQMLKSCGGHTFLSGFTGATKSSANPDIRRRIGRLVCLCVVCLLGAESAVYDSASTPLFVGADGCREGADVVFVVEYSATLDEFQYRKLLDFVIAVVAQLDVDSGAVRVAVITFSDTSTVQFHLSAYNTRLDVANAIIQLPYRGYTADISTGLRSLRDVFELVYNTMQYDARTCCWRCLHCHPSSADILSAATAHHLFGTSYRYPSDLSTVSTYSNRI